MKKGSHYKFLMFPFLIFHLLVVSFSDKREETQVLFRFSVTCILLSGP